MRRIHKRNQSTLFLILILSFPIAAYSDVLNSWSWSGDKDGADNGNCTGICTKGNYNQQFKRELCERGSTPGSDLAEFYNGRIRVEFNGYEKLWDKENTKQDHQGVCANWNEKTNALLFHDGCTGYPPGNPPLMNKGPNAGWNASNWGQVFHGACIMHDLCYQNEPGFSGKTRAQCDGVFYKRAIEICNHSYQQRSGWQAFFKPKPLSACKSAATLARGLMVFGSKNHYKKFNFGSPWSVSDICSGDGQFNVTTSQCQ